MADKISQDRAKDSSIKTDDLDLGSLDDIDLDFPGEGDEGVDKGKSRRPSNPKKEFAIEAAKGLGGGVKAATAAELRKVLPDGAAIVDTASATFEEFKALKEDLSRELNPMMVSVENASRKLLPRVKNFIPQKLYDRLNRKLEDRAAARAGSNYSGPSKEQMEQQQIAAELSEIFAAQTEMSARRDADETIARMTDRALSAAQNKKQTIQLTHLYDAVRSTEMFHRTQHMAYMKKSLELKYKHIFIARDTFNLLQASLKTYEGYLKEILHNSSLPDMVKVQSGDYIHKNRTEKYGTMMTNALGSIRSKIMGKIKDAAKSAVSQAGMMTDMLGMGADQLEMQEMMGQKPSTANLLGKGLGWVVGRVGGAPLIKKGLDKLAPIIGPANTSLAGMRANAAVTLEKKRQEWLGSDNLIKSTIAEFLPDTFSQQTSASNDLLNKSKDATPFDVLTRQSIVEIIPGYLGKILHSVDIMRTGDENTQEQVFNTFERKFTDVETLRADVTDRAFGDADSRKAMLTRTLAKMQAGAARNTPGKNADDLFKGLEKDINRFFLNHAQYGLVFDPEKIREFMSQGADSAPSNYIRRACNGFENNPKKVMQAICETMYNAEGRLDKNVYNDIQLSITEHYRKLDQYKEELPNVFENLGYRRFFSGELSGQEEKKLKKIAAGPDKKAAQAAKGKLSRGQGIISSVAYDNMMNFDKMVDARAGDIDFDTIDTSTEAWARREAYDRYRNYDASVATMRQHGGKLGNRLLDTLGFGNREAGAAYDESFAAPTEGAETPKKKSFADVIRAGKDKLKSLGESVTAKLSPVVSSQYNSAVKQINTYKDKFFKTETGKKVGEQLEVLESLFKSAQKQGSEGIQWLKDQGAFDDPVGFLKRTYGETVISAKHLGEQLPALTDVDGWKQFASDRLDASSDFVKSKMESLKSTSAYAKAAEIAGSVKSQASSILNSIGIPSPKSPAPSIPPTPASPVEDLSKAINNTVDNTVAPTVAAMPDEAIDRLDKIIELITEWKSENVSNQGTIFDAVSKLSEISDNQGTLFDTLAQIDEDIKRSGGGGVGGSINEEELAKHIGEDMRKNSLMRKGLHAAKEGIAGAVKGVGKVYTRVYSAALKGAGTAIKGIGFAAGKAIDKTYKAASGIGKWLTGKEDYVDIYVKGKEGGMPLVSARKQKDPDEGIFFKSNGKRVMHSRDIDSPCVDRNGQLVITEEDIKAGLVMNNSSPIGKIGSGLLALGKGYFSVYGKALTAIGSVTKAVAQGIFGKAAERYEDVYRKDEVDKGPLVTARKQKEEGIFFFQSGKRVDKTSDIHEPVCDRDRKVIISKEDIEHGLVNVDNKPLGSGATGGALRALARGIGGALPGIGKFIGKVGGGLMDIYAKGYKGLMDIAFKGIKGAGKFIGRALGLNMEGMGGGVSDDLKNVIIDTNSVLHQMQLDLAKIASNFKSQSMEGTAPTSTPPPSGSSGAPSSGPAEHTAGREGETASASTAASSASSDDAGGSLFGSILSSPIVGSMRERFSSFKNRMSSMFSSSKKGVETSTNKEADGSSTTEIATPEGTEITVEPAMAPTTETAIVSTDTNIASIFDLLKRNLDKKNSLDKDGDGDIDGSYADQMEKKKESDQKRIDARDVHKDVNWLKKDEDKEGGGKDDKEGGGLFDALGKLIPKKYRAKFDLFRKSFANKMGKFAKSIGGKVLKFGKGLNNGIMRAVSSIGSKVLSAGKTFGAKAMPYLGKAGSAALNVGKTFGGKALSLGAKALPWVAKAGGAAMHGLGAMGSAAGGLLGSAGSAISGGLASMGGLAGLGSTLAAVAGPAALAALAGYGIYRGVKGFSKKNTLENVGKSEGISKENQLTGEDRMYSALGLNSKIGAKTVKFISQGLGIHGLIKGIRGNDNPLTDKEIEKGRTKLQRKILKGLPGYDRILQEYEKAVTAGNWKRARELSGQEADGLIKSMWKNSYAGMAVKGIGNFLFGNKNEEMSKEEIEKARAKFDSIIRKGGRAGKNAEILLGKFDDAVSEQDWKRARQIAGAEKRGLFGKLFQDSKGNIKWGTVIGGVLGGVPGLIIGSLFNKADVNKPMSEEEVKKARARLQKLIDGGNKAAQKVLDQFDEAVTEQNWKKARKLVGEEVQSNLKKLGSGLKTAGKWYLRIGTLGLSTLFESDQDKPMTDEEIKKFTDKMNFLIDKHNDKLAKKKLEKFEEAVAAQKWDKARQIAKMPHKSLATRALKATWNWAIGSDEQPMTEQEMKKFRDSMERKINLGNTRAKKKLEAFEDAVGAQRWKRARQIAQSPNDGWMVKGAKAYGKFAANNWRLIFGGDGKPMSESEIEQARKEMGWAIQENKKGAQKRLDLFNDYVADEKWEKARKLAKMPYENVIKRAGKAIGNFLFGNDKDALTAEEIDKFQKECEQRIADGVKGDWNKVLDQFNSAVESENWAKARKLSGMKAEGAVKKVAKALNPLNWFKDDYTDCQKKKEELEEKAMDDETGLINKGLEKFDVLVRRQQYSDAMKLADDLLKLKPAELAKKHGLKSDEYDQILKDGQSLQARIDKALKKEKTGLFPSLKAVRLQTIKNELIGNQVKWGEDYFEEIRDKLSSITGEDEYSDIDQVDDKVIKEGQTLLDDIKKSKEHYSWFTSPIIRTKLASLENEVKGEMADWNEGSFTAWQERLKEIDKDYKTPEERKADEERLEKIEDKAQEDAGSKKKHKSEEAAKLSASGPQNQLAVDYYGDVAIKREPWLAEVEDPGNPESEMKAEKAWKDRQSGAKTAALDAYRWRGKTDKNGKPVKADKSATFESSFPGGTKAHQMIGNKLEGWEWDLSKSDTVTKWEDGTATEIPIAELSDKDLAELTSQAYKSNVSNAILSELINKQQKLAQDEINRRQKEKSGNDGHGSFGQYQKELFKKGQEDKEIAQAQDDTALYQKEDQKQGFFGKMMSGLGKSGASIVGPTPMLGGNAAPDRNTVAMAGQEKLNKIMKKRTGNDGHGEVGKYQREMFKKEHGAKLSGLCPEIADVISADDTEGILAKIKLFEFDVATFTKLMNEGLCCSLVDIGTNTVLWNVNLRKKRQYRADTIEEIGQALQNIAVVGDKPDNDDIREECENAFLILAAKMHKDPKPFSKELNTAFCEYYDKDLDDTCGIGLVYRKFNKRGLSEGRKASEEGKPKGLSMEFDPTLNQVYSPELEAATGMDKTREDLHSVLQPKDLPLDAFQPQPVKDYIQDQNTQLAAKRLKDSIDNGPLKPPSIPVDNVSRNAPDLSGGSFATSETPAIDADGNPLIYGEAGTEAIMPIRNKPGNLLSRVGSKLGDILNGEPVGPMDDGASKASVHAGTDESEPMENMMANELAKTVESKYRHGGFSRFANGGFTQNPRTKAINDIRTKASQMAYDHKKAGLKPYEDGPNSYSNFQDWASKRLMEAGIKGRDFINLFNRVGAYYTQAYQGGSAVFANGGFVKKFADGGFVTTRAEINAYEDLLGKFEDGKLSGMPKLIASAYYSGKNGSLYNLPTDAELKEAGIPVGGSIGARHKQAMARLMLAKAYRSGKAAAAYGSGDTSQINESIKSLKSVDRLIGTETSKTTGSNTTAVASPVKGSTSTINSSIADNTVHSPVANKALTDSISSVHDTSLLQQPTSKSTGAADISKPDTKNSVSSMDRLTNTLSKIQDQMKPAPAAPNVNTADNGDSAKKLAEMTEINKQLLSLLQKVLVTEGVKVAGLDMLTQVCASSGQSTQIIQQAAPANDDVDQRGIDLRRKLQM